MKSRTNPQFWGLFRELPSEIQERAREAYRAFLANPNHPGLQFKRVHPALRIYSARITRDYRAVGVMKDDTIVWFWVGTHSDYDRLLAKR